MDVNLLIYEKTEILYHKRSSEGLNCQNVSLMFQNLLMFWVARAYYFLRHSHFFAVIIIFLRAFCQGIAE